jgi:hypothetical protein
MQKRKIANDISAVNHRAMVLSSDKLTMHNGQGAGQTEIPSSPSQCKSKPASKPRRKKRVRGEKPRMRSVLRQYERPAQVNLGRGRTRALDVAPKRTAENAVPRRLRALLAAKAKLEMSLEGKDAILVGRGLRRGSESRNNDHTGPKEKSSESQKKPNALEAPKRMTRKEILIQSVRQNSHQVEKKRAYYAKKAERADLRKERRKRRRSGQSSDCSGSEDSDDVETHVKRPRFGEQAQAPPKLVPVRKRHGTSRVG